MILILTFSVIMCASILLLVLVIPTFISCSEPEARILGDGDIFVQSDSALNITCLISHLADDSEDIMWLHEGKVRLVI